MEADNVSRASEVIGEAVAYEVGVCVVLFDGEIVGSAGGIALSATMPCATETTKLAFPQTGASKAIPSFSPGRSLALIVRRSRPMRAPLIIP